MQLFAKKQTEEPKDARFMIDRGVDVWGVFQKSNDKWVHRGNFNSLDDALNHVRELREYPMYFA